MNKIQVSFLLGRRTKGIFCLLFSFAFASFRKGFLQRISYFIRKKLLIKAGQITFNLIGHSGNDTRQCSISFVFDT